MDHHLDIYMAMFLHLTDIYTVYTCMITRDNKDIGGKLPPIYCILAK